MIRRVSALVGTALLTVASLAWPAPSAAGHPFTDISGSSFEEHVVWAFDNGVAAGCTADKFCPKSAVTREQMATFLDRMFDFPATSEDFFPDDETSTHENAINRLAAAGVTGGCSSTRFCPKSAVTREQMASFIARAAELDDTGNNPFYDDDFRTHENNIGRIAAEGIGTGCGEWKFCPTAVVNREQMVTFLHRVVDPVAPVPQNAPCDRSYTPALCIPSPPPQLDCTDIPYENFFVRPPDPHVFDGNLNGVGCET
jgi:S-layer homology domain